MIRRPALTVALVLSLWTTLLFVALGSATYREQRERAVFEERPVIEVIHVQQPKFSSTDPTCAGGDVVPCPGPGLASDVVVLLGTEQGQTVKYRLGPVVVGTGDVASATAAHASTSPGSPAEWFVEFHLTAPGTTRFANVTTTFLGKQLAIIVNGQVISAPTINSPITGGDGVITGNFTEERANQLASALASPFVITRDRVWFIPAALSGLTAIVLAMLLIWGGGPDQADSPNEQGRSTDAG